ncbi:MAG: large-conductance mechanosensitive channel protein MscL [Ignavibacteria bacterium]|nr:large-conductance mechanosensitive channel protein MscL [Ignavibacteria bacterium]
MIKEFKEFALKGNLVDMAVAFVLGVAFGKVVSSFIDGIVMPLVGLITAGIDFKELKYVLNPAQTDQSGKIISEEVALRYGEFISVTLDFVLVAFFMFLIVKAMNRMRQVEEAAPQPPSEEEKLLREIRDILKK